MKEQTKPYRGTAYDDVFRTLLVDCRQLIIPVVNEVFQENYSGEEEVVFSQNEHFLNQQDGGQEKRITDTSFTIVGVERRKYLMECQSRPDSSMLIRIFEYVTQIALDEGELDKEKLRATFPRSAVIYLRSNRNTPDRMEIQISTPGQETPYEARVMRLSDYTLERIFQKNLLFLLPFYIFTHEKHFAEYEKDDVKLDTLKVEYQYIARRLDELVEQGKINAIVCRTLMEMSIKVVENIAVKYENVWEGVKEIMGGKILEYETKTILREGRSQGLSQGLKEGRSQGLSQGLIQGACQNLIHNVDNVMKNLGWSLDDACRLVGSSSEEYQRAKETLRRRFSDEAFMETSFNAVENSAIKMTEF